MRFSGAVYVTSALVVFVAQLVEVPSINTWKPAGFYDSSIFTTITSYPVYATLVAIVCLFCFAVVQTRVFLSFVATLDDHDLRHITILDARLAYAFRSLAALLQRFWRRFWLVFIIFVTFGVFWPTQILALRFVCSYCSATTYRPAGPQTRLGRLGCDRSSFSNVHRRPTYLILVSVARLISLWAVGTVRSVVLAVLTYTALVTYTVSAVHAPRKAISSVERHVSVIHSSSSPHCSGLELLPELSFCRLPIPIISAHELSSRFPKDYLIHPDFITKYELGAELGKGGNGFVLQARRRTDGQQVAVKLSRKPKRFSYRWSKHPTYGFVNSDVLTMDIARHENMIALLDVFSDETYLYAVQELYGTLSFIGTEKEYEHLRKKWPNGSRCLESYIRVNGPMSVEDAKNVFYQLVDAVAHLHSLGISHCDIKPENILIDATTLKIKLIDFGNVLRLPEGCDPKTGGRLYIDDPRHFLGTRMFTPPEIHNGEKYEANAADVWAMGLVLCFMILGHLPLFSRDIEDLKNGLFGCHDQCLDALQPVWFIAGGCLKSEMLLRPRAVELQLHDDYLPIALRRDELETLSKEELWQRKFDL